MNTCLPIRQKATGWTKNAVLNSFVLSLAQGDLR